MRNAFRYSDSSHSCGGVDCEDCGRFFGQLSYDPLEQGVMGSWFGLFVAAFVVAAVARQWPAKGIIFVIGATLIFWGLIALT